MIGGWLGPLFGPLSDYLGNRSITMSLFLLPSVAAFILYATTTITPWVGIVLMGITYGWGDTVSYSSIRLLVGVEKAGLGYGLFGLVGNIFGLTVPIIGGLIFEAANGEARISPDACCSVALRMNTVPTQSSHPEVTASHWQGTLPVDCGCPVSLPAQQC